MWVQQPSCPRCLLLHSQDNPVLTAGGDSWPKRWSVADPAELLYYLTRSWVEPGWVKPGWVGSEWVELDLVESDYQTRNCPVSGHYRQTTTPSG